MKIFTYFVWLAVATGCILLALNAYDKFCEDSWQCMVFDRQGDCIWQVRGGR